MFFRKGAIILITLTGIFGANAEEKKPCIIFQGTSGKNQALDLDAYNRISFGETAMTLSSSKKTGPNKDILYSAYNKFKIGDAVPTGSEAESITLSQTSASLKVGESLKLTATVMPSDATDKTVVWSSSNPSVAGIDASGNVTALSAGNATIKASCGSVSASCFVTVEKSNGIETVDAESDTRLYVDSDKKYLYLESMSNADFTIRVYNDTGYLLLTSELFDDETVNIESLVPGVYIAVASDGKNKITLKFVK